MKTCLLACIAALFVANGAFAQQDAVPAVPVQLQAYYDRGTAPPWPEEVKRLSAPSPDERMAAANYLVALLDQSLTDELSGKAPWRATPYWGSRGENPARNLRKEIAESLAQAQGSAQTLTVLRWYFLRENVAHFQKVVLPALGKVDEKDAEPFCLALLQPEHENSVVVVAAMTQIPKTRKTIPEAVLLALCNHHRLSIRTQARALHRAWGGAEPAPFDAAAAMQRPAMAALMTHIGALLDESASPDAVFMKVTTEYKNKDGAESRTTVGWVVKSDDKSCVVLTPFGHREEFQSELKEGRYGTTSKSSWVKHAVADEVRRVADLRQKGDPEHDLSERGGLTGQFEGGVASLYEVTLAHWLYTAKQFELSAQLLLPALDTFYMDRHLIDMIRHRVGNMAGYKMLVAFAGDRDFAETERLAKALVQKYPGTQFHEYAVKFTKELPRRAADFKELKLPTPEEWTELKKKLSRSEQIDYLAQRMRLLNCFQWGQPGGYSITDRQTAEPNGLSRNAAWGGGLGKTKVINPFVELFGGHEGAFVDQDPARSKGMELTVADIPQLANYLRDDWFILCVSFWRDFSSDRDLGTTRPLFARAINELAKHDLCKPHELDGKSDVEIEAYLDSIRRWAKENAGRSEQDLLWLPLENAVKAGHYYADLPNVDALAKLKDKRLAPVLLDYLEKWKEKGVRPNPNEFRVQGMDVSTSSYRLRDLLDACLVYDPPAFREPARKLVQHKNVGVRLRAAHILFSGGDVSAGREVFADVLRNATPQRDYGESDLRDLVTALLKDGSPDSRKVARLVFDQRNFVDIRDGWARAEIVHQCAAAGIGDGYLAYIPLLEIKDNKIGGSSYSEGTVVGEIIAREVVEDLGRHDADVARVGKTHEKPADQIAPLKALLREKAKALEGK